MQPDPQDGAGREPPPQAQRTPNSDMQAEDAGTPDSGNPGESGGTSAESAMKQTSKTESESGNRR